MPDESDFEKGDRYRLWEQCATIRYFDVRTQQDMRVSVIRSSWYMMDVELYVN